jgi:hypothetical protein
MAHLVKTIINKRHFDMIWFESLIPHRFSVINLVMKEKSLDG